MESPKYDGTIHPTEWVKQVRLFCQLMQITNEQEILNICKLSINSNINISRKENINTIDELIKVLKQDTFFTIFKNDSKRELSSMNYIFSGSHIKFMKEFLTLCYNAEIMEEINEVKKYLCKTLKNQSLREEFNSKMEKVESIDELLKQFEEIVFRPIKYGSRVALKHVVTRKYLTSINRIYEDFNQQIVFAGKSSPTSDSVWVITPASDDKKIKKIGDIVEYEDFKFSLINERTNKVLYGGPGNPAILAFCGLYEIMGDVYGIMSDVGRILKFQNVKSKEIKSFVEPRDIINIISLYYRNQYVLRSHEETFKVGNDTFQKVISHNEIDGEIGKNDEWCIELVE